MDRSEKNGIRSTWIYLLLSSRVLETNFSLFTCDRNADPKVRKPEDASLIAYDLGKTTRVKEPIQ
jgi:hypothetical protein